MPQVPVYDTRTTVDLKPGSNFRDPTHATGEMFGSQVGKAMGDVAKGGLEVANQIAEARALDDLNIAKERDNQFSDWLRERQYGEGGILAAKGRDAVDQQRAFEEEARLKRGELGRGLSPGASKLYGDVSQNRLNGSLTQSAAHVMTERRTWFSQTSDDRAKTFANDALVSFNNPDEVNKNVAAGIMEIREQAKVGGWDKDTLRLRETEYASGIHKNITMRIAQTDPIKAAEYRQRNAKFLTGADQYALDGHLDKAVIEEQSRREADKIMTSSRDMSSTDVGGIVDRVAGEEGVNAGLMRRIVNIESGFNPRRQTGSYKGIGQLSDGEFTKHMPEGGDIWNAGDNARATARKLKSEVEWFKGKYGREPTGTDIYVVHQQGQGGYDAHVKNPDGLAWQNMASTAEGRDKGEKWAKDAIWKNVPEDMRKLFPNGVEDVTSGDFLKIWRSKMGEGDAPGPSAGVSRPGPTKERAFLMSRLQNGHDASHINGLDGSFAANLAAMMQDAPPGIREGLGVLSGARTEQRQAELWDEALRKYGSPEEARKWVAPPGKSMHNHGRAVDISYNGKSLKDAPQEVVDWVHSNASKYGLYFPLGNEPWHVEPVGSRVGGGVVAARSDNVTPRSQLPSYDDIERQLQGIKDPKVRDMTRTRIEHLMAARVKSVEQQERAAKAELWRYIDQGKSPDDVPFDVRQAAGMAAVWSAWDYAKKKADGTFSQSDEVLLYDMRRFAAMRPEEFAKIDLNDYRGRLSKSEIDELTGKQTSALTDMRKAKDDGANITAAFSQAHSQLDAVGITAEGKKGNAKTEAAKQIAQFNNALAQEMEAFKRANNDRAPNQIEVQGMINKLLMPVVIKQDRSAWNPMGWFGGQSETKGFAFQAATRPDGSTVVGATKYEDVPIDLRRGITMDLERQLGRKPSKEEVARRYEDFVLRR